RVRSLIDVGTGAGFPGIPVAIAFPEIEVTVIDSTRKKIDFIRTAVREIGLTNVKALHLRAEDGARDPALRESFDLATARAVAALDLLLEWLLPFVRVGGAAVALKGDSVDEELPAAKDIAPKLGGALLAPERFNIPMSAIERSFVVARKDSRCSATYPRPATQARKRH
ncbi:MAG: ribosomal small subunit methyltransferase, partial [Pseudomonadota bacterium]